MMKNIVQVFQLRGRPGVSFSHVCLSGKRHGRSLLIRRLSSYRGLIPGNAIYPTSTYNTQDRHKMSKDSNQAESTGFQPLSHFISVYKPRDPAKGQLVILATWVGSTAKNIARYTFLYKKVAPSAKILLIRGLMENSLAHYPIPRTNIRPAIDPIAQVLKECGYSINNLDAHHGATRSSINPRILLHIFSNGGANNVLQHLQVWQSETGRPLPLSGLVIDSALAIGGAKQNYRGFQQNIPSAPLYNVFGPIAASYASPGLRIIYSTGQIPKTRNCDASMYLQRNTHTFQRPGERLER